MRLPCDWKPPRLLRSRAWGTRHACLRHWLVQDRPRRSYARAKGQVPFDATTVTGIKEGLEGDLQGQQDSLLRLKLRVDGGDDAHSTLPLARPRNGLKAS
jgi:hypothetical protein